VLTKKEQDTLYQQLGELIKEQRNKVGVSQEDLAKYLGFSSRISIVNIENGKQKVQLHTLLDICELINIPVSSIIPSLETIKTTKIGKEVEPSIKKDIGKEISDTSSVEKIKGFYRLSLTKNKT